MATQWLEKKVKKKQNKIQMDTQNMDVLSVLQ